MRRAAPLLAGMAGVGIVVPLFVGVGPGAAMFLVPIFGVVGVVTLVGSRRPAVVERGWSGAPAALAPGMIAEQTSRSPRERPPARRVAAALARVEARDLATSPWFGVGLGFLVVSFLLLAVVYADDNASHWREMVDLAPWLAHPLVGMVVIAAHAGVTRSRRDGTDELFDTCPTAPTTRTWGSLGSGLVPVVALAAFALVFGLTVAVRSPNLYGSVGSGAAAQILGALALGSGGVALGVALGRWVPFPLAPVGAVVAVGFLSLRLGTVGDPDWNPLQQLSTLPPTSDIPIFTEPRVWSHLAWVLSLTGAVVVVAVARHRRDRTVATAGLAVCVLLAATGIAATRPVTGSSAARIAALVARPADHQVCRPASAIQVCVYRGHEELLGRVVAEIASVAAMLPDGAPAATLRQRYEHGLNDLPPEVRRLLPQGVPPVPDGEVPLGYSVSRSELRVPRFLVGLQALGLPAETAPDDRPLVIAGQARGVVVLWLALRGLDGDAVRRLTAGASGHDIAGRQPDAFDRGYAWPEGCSTPPVVWSSQDLRAARALSSLPEDAVRTLVHDGWARWRDPATGTDALMAAAGLPPVGPFDAVQTRRVDPC